MIVILLSAGIAIALIAMAWWLLRGNSAAVAAPEDLIGQVRAVDLAAFRNLTDPEEDRFLRSRLAASAFRRVQRKRKRAAMEYVSWVGHNAAIVLRLGEAARRSSSPEVSRAGEELVRTAISVRGYVLLAWMALALGVILPGASISLSQVAQSYEHLRGSLDMLIRMQQAGTAARVMAGL